MNAGVISGGGGHFSIVGGFSGSLVAGTPAAYVIHFDTTGVGADYLRGHAHVLERGRDAARGPRPAGPGRDPARASHLRGRGRARRSAHGAALLSAAPNPAAGAIQFAYDLPKAAPVRLEVFDLSGRRVANVASGQTEAGHHELRWSPRGDGGGVAAGLYFARFSVPGMTRMVRIVLLP